MRANPFIKGSELQPDAVHRFNIDSDGDAMAAGALLPDILRYCRTPAGPLPNGRVMTDDVGDPAPRAACGRHPAMILINVVFPIRPEKIDEWLALATTYAEAVEAEEGCLFFQWSRRLDDPTLFVAVEGFRDAAAGQAHVGTAQFADLIERAPDLVAEQPRIIYIDAPDVDGWGPMGEITPR